MRLEITNIDNYDYTLKDENNKEYVLNIRFYDLPIKIKEGDYLYLTYDIINEVNLFNFGYIEEESKLKLISDNKIYYLKRYYG